MTTGLAHRFTESFLMSLMSHIGDSRTNTQVHWAKVHRYNHVLRGTTMFNQHSFRPETHSLPKMNLWLCEFFLGPMPFLISNRQYKRSNQRIFVATFHVSCLSPQTQSVTLTHRVEGKQRSRSFQTIASHLQFQHCMHYNILISVKRFIWLEVKVIT